MSFTADIKEELLQDKNENECCDYAELAGILAFSSGIKKDYLKVTIENHLVAFRIVYLLKKLFEVVTAVEVKPKSSARKADVYTVLLKDYKKVLRGLKLMERGEVAFQFPKDLLVKDCCARSFLRGAFLGGGSVADPEKRYHLEFVTHHYLFSRDFLTIFRRFDIPAKQIMRKSAYVTYFKDSEIICDVLAAAGASAGVMDIYNVKITREIKNETNRIVNSESANISRIVNASVYQVSCIKKIEESAGLESLSEPLEELARLRLKNREAGLAALGQMLSPPLGKSGVNHRMRKIIEISEKIEKS